jgi:hypothetical protein
MICAKWLKLLIAMDHGSGEVKKKSQDYRQVNLSELSSQVCSNSKDIKQTKVDNKIIAKTLLFKKKLFSKLINVKWLF